MIAPIKGPTKGSGAYTALQHLQNVGGQATPADLMTQLVWSDTPGRFQRLIVGPLERQRLVLRRDDLVALTNRGVTFLTPSAEAAAPVPPGPYAAPFQPLRALHRPAALALRPGAADYRTIPSRIGEHVIAHGKKAVA